MFVKVEESDDFTLKYLSGTNYRKLKGTMTKPNCYIQISEYHIFTLRYLRKSLIIVHDTVVPTIRRVASLEGEKLVVYYYLNAFESWPDKRGDLWWKWPYKKGTTVT